MSRGVTGIKRLPWKAVSPTVALQDRHVLDPQEAMFPFANFPRTTHNNFRKIVSSRPSGRAD